MERRKTLKDIIKVTLSNASLLLAGVATSFVLPKFFSMQDYGLYKVFNLYTTYIVLLQFGLSEGLYLYYGGRKKEEVSSEKFSIILWTVILLDAIIAATVIVVSYFALSEHYRFIFLMIAFDILIVNITNIYQFLSQAIQRFTELSIRNLAKSVMTIVAVVLIAMINTGSDNVYLGYRFYIITVVIINALLLGWYVFTYRDLLQFGIKIEWKTVWIFAKSGFPLCLSNVISSLILAMDRQVVSIFFSTEEYAVYSFAYSMLTLFSTVITSIAVVIFPLLKQKAPEELKKEYKSSIAVIAFVISIMAIGYFPLCWFVKSFLPAYVASLDIFRIIIPGLMISSPVSIIIHNYFKTLNKNGTFFVSSSAILGLSIVFNLIAYFIFGTMSSISYASILVLLIWYFLEELLLKREIQVESLCSIVYILLMGVLFFCIAGMPSWIVGGITYLFAVVIGTLLFNFSAVNRLLKVIKGRE